MKDNDCTAFFISPKWYCLCIAVMLFCFDSKSQKNTILSKSIREFKETRFAELMKAQIEFQCANDTIFLPDSFYARITLKDGTPVKQIGTNPYSIPASKFAKYGVDIADKKAVVKFLADIQAKYKPYECKCGETSSIVKWLLDEKADELRTCVNYLTKTYKNLVKEFNPQNIFFENYQSNDIISEYNILNGEHVIFFNERLLSLCEFFSSLAYGFSKHIDSAGRKGLIFPKGIDDSIKNSNHAKQQFINGILSFHYGCPRPFTEFGDNVLKFKEYMEMFVLAHEYAHAVYGHNSYHNKFGEILSKDEKRQLYLNSWFNEIQADIFAQNILIAKHRLEYPDSSHLVLLLAGSFYLTCIDLLEKSKLVLSSNDINGDSTINFYGEAFKKLQDIVNPFPLSLMEMNVFDVKPEYIELIDAVIPNSHPPAWVRAYNLFTTVITLVKRDSKTPERGLANIMFAYEMCAVLYSLYFNSKNDLIKAKQK